MIPLFLNLLFPCFSSPGECQQPQPGRAGLLWVLGTASFSQAQQREGVWGGPGAVPPHHEEPLCQRFSGPPGYLGLASPLELLNFVPQAELSPPSIQKKNDKLTDLSQNPSRGGQVLDVGCCFLCRSHSSAGSSIPTAMAWPCLSSSPRLPHPSPGDLAAAPGCLGVPGSRSRESGFGCQTLCPEAGKA